MPSKRLSFENAHGQTLSARLDLPIDGAPLAYALFAHCFTCSKDLRAVRTISDTLAQAHIAVLSFDFTGLGMSEGSFDETTFSSDTEDLLAAAEFLARDYQAPQLLIGHSLGGAAILRVASRIPSSRAVVTIGAPSEPKHVEKLLSTDLAEIEARGEAEVRLAGRTFTITKGFLDDLQAQSMAEAISQLKRALLIFHAPLDNIVGIDNAEAIFRAAKHPKSFVSLDRADHLLTRPEDASYVGEVIASWSWKYLQIEEKPDWMDDVRDNRVAVRTEEGLRTEMLANGFSLVADEPERLGGTGTGPTPYDYLAAALGACTGMTLRMYADRKTWPLEAVTVTVSHSKVHAQDGEPDAPSGKIDRFERTIRLEGPLDIEQRQRLLDIANRCPVHRTLESRVLVTTELA